MGTSSENDLAGKPIGQGPTLTFLRNRAAVDGGEMKLITFDQKDAGLNAAEINGDAVHDEVEQFVDSRMLVIC